MTKREAIMILIHHAARDCAGTGCGIRTLPSDEEIREVVQAILKVWPQKHFPPNFFNMGLPDPGANVCKNS